MEDIAVVLDAVGSERAALLATAHAGLAAIMFAATYPDRTLALILSSTWANLMWSEETPWEWTEDRWERYIQDTTQWSRAHALEDVRRDDPSMAGDRGYVDWWYRYILLSEAPGGRRGSHEEVHGY